MPEVWSAIMVQEVIYNMAEFAARKCEGWDDNEDWDYTTENPEITDAEMEQIAPGTIQQVTEIMARHVPSDEMYLAIYAAIYAKAREFARPPSTKWTRKTRQNSSIPPGRRSTRPGPERRSTRPGPERRSTRPGPRKRTGKR